ncbi:MAG: CAP domain-containing protein, partial [Faecousia sp.]
MDSDAPYTGEAPRQEVVNETVLNTEDVCQEIVDLTNDLRRERGLSTFITDDKLMEAAQVRAEEMASTTTYSHTRPDGRQYYTVTDCPYTAENIHRIAARYLTQHGVGLAEVAVDGWANSETHLRNILNDRLSSIGVGIAKGVNASGEESWYCVQL